LGFHAVIFMTLSNLAASSSLPMMISDPRHMTGSIPSGANIADLTQQIGAESVLQSDNFADAMLRALDKVSGDQQKAESLIQTAIIDPDAVDIHDITIAQAEASMSLNIARTVLNRLVQDWKDIINTR
jgi:flagellar hook-basal body complex protein FliE